MEITPREERELPKLAELLPPGAAIYIAHGPSTTLAQVAKTALAVQCAGFKATPHIVARRLNYAHTLRITLAQLCAGGVEQILLVAGDGSHTTGDFENTLDVISSADLENSGMKRLGVAGHPEGHNKVGAALLWNALHLKQAFAERSGMEVFTVAQFGFLPNAVAQWEDELTRRGIRLPIHVGIADPGPLSKLIRFAMACGIGASLRKIMHNLSEAGGTAELAIRPEQHVMSLMRLAKPATLVVAPHFFSFGAALDTARWIKRVTAGEFSIDFEDGRMELKK
jgi:methylenetetrahydrofolate reductase (NADPH)